MKYILFIYVTAGNFVVPGGTWENLAEFSGKNAGQLCHAAAKDLDINQQRYRCILSSSKD